MEDSFPTLEPSCFNSNKIGPTAQNVAFPDSKSSVETASSSVAENDSAFVEISDSSEVSSRTIILSETFSELSFSRNNPTRISLVDEHDSFLKADSGLFESESIIDDSSKLTGFQGVEQILSKNSDDMTFDFNLLENYGDFEDNEFHSSIDFFNDPSFINFLENVSSRVPLDPLVVRDSLYRNFDPLYATYFSKHDNIINKQLNVVKDETNTKIEKSPDTVTLNNTQNEVQSNASLRQSIGNMLISFESPIFEKCKTSLSENLSICDSQKLYTEEDLKKALENKELALRGAFLRKQRDLEDIFLKRTEELKTEFEKQKRLSDSLSIILKEAMHLVDDMSQNMNSLARKLAKAEQDKEKLKDDLDLFVNDLQSIENTFSDFHKEFEQSTTVLKLYIKNENLMKQLENVSTQLDDKEKLCKELQNLSFKMDKSDIISPRKSSEF